MAASVPDALLGDALRGLAGRAAFDRGVEIERQESVGDVRETDGGVRARVTASAGIGSYAVGLHLRDGRVQGECTCPAGAQRVFCKHQVAVARRWRGELERAALAETEPLGPMVAALTRERLEAIVLEHAVGDPRLDARVRRAARGH